MIKVYLAGYSGENEYREYVSKRYGRHLDVFDPMKEIDYKILEKYRKGSLPDEDVSLIVEGDKAAIESCDIVIAYIKQASFGTAMEILHAFKNKIPVYLIDPHNKWRDDVWVRYHTSKTFDDIDPCFSYILESIKGL
jgi:nucleoside 2-deoxyribosyltransferase